MSYTGPDPGDALRNPGYITGTVFCLGSLAWSIYALTRPPPPVVVMPAALVSPDGLAAPGLVVAGHF